ncbi:DUF3772 domain-containing protein [Sulfitobacter aestuariivivens]|uniref:Mechanosensitive ion channel family protein n=1 Tax=Sulfitobacter aestuariivivens TaxID=2766981 RepID=A0A927HFG1_9RHOB|nr:DUF3772 domain-containing protein [Sulfitobacter aestuariivivens]MBD3663205.1 mechanosensitive ion channel family protein [Sulfitobacter aestuariivivens]
MRMVRHFLWILALLASMSGLAVAQDTLLKDMERWDNLANRTETAVDAPDANRIVLEAMRVEIVEFREEFDSARNLNAGRIATLREQIAALGTPPEGEGAQPEPVEVTAKRDELTKTLNTLLAPVQQAEAAYLRADSLVAQIDDRLRNEQTQRLLSLSPSPLNPVNWPVALHDIRQSLAAVATETKGVSIMPGGQARENLPLVVVMTLLGLVLIMRGRTWSAQIVRRLRTNATRGFGIWQFVASLLRVILPVAGIALLLGAVIQLAILDKRLTELAYVVAGLAALMLCFRWVSERVFHRDEDIALISLPDETRRRARFYVAFVTIVVVLSGLALGLLQTGETNPATLPVVAFPFFIAISFALFRLGQCLRGYREEIETPDPDTENRSSSLSRFVRGLGTGAMVVACIAPLLMAAGYFELASAIQRPYILSLAVLGLVLALQRFLADIYGAITGQGAAARDALMPVLLGMLLVLLSLPVLALIWGARITDLSEIWTSFSRGFSIGDSRISPTDFLYFVVIFAVGYVVTRIVQGTLRTNVLPKTKIDIGGQNAIVSGLGYVGIFIAALLAITGAGIDLSSLAIVAGALSVGIGFGLQNIVSNFVSGIILLIERPISEGDWIEVGGQMGYVRDISVRSTRIETFDRTDVIVPNADLVSGTVTNYTRGNTVGRVIVAVGVAYGTDTRKVEKILREIAEGQPMVLATPPPGILFVNFGADALEFEIRAYLRDVNWMMVVKNEINHAIAARFAEEGIEIPFAQRDLWLRNPETLRQDPGSEETE